jgi:two-component system response regulator YesN
VEKVCSYIREHIHEDIGRDDLAASVHLNPAYLSRMFKKEKGISLSNYIVQEKINKAKELLADTNYKISSIADAVGYQYYSYFSKLFRTIVGVSPQEYRKQYQKV